MAYSRYARRSGGSYRRPAATTITAPVEYKPMATPSVYQERIFDWVEHGTGDGIVNAVAGSGKTTTLVEIAHRIHVDALFCSFNKHIVEELESRLSGTRMTASTLHSVGNRTLRRALGAVKVDYNKYDKLARDAMNDVLPSYLGASPDMQRTVLASLTHLVDLTRLTLTDPDDKDAMDTLCDHHGVDIPTGKLLDWDLEAAMYRAVRNIIDEGVHVAQSGGHQIDFTDMVYLPHRMQITPQQFAWVLVDEAQDMNAAQLALALSCRAPGGRLMFVGDRNQAIYGFAGADAYSFDTIKTRTNATELPLSICYRCPASHVSLAKLIVPQIEARPGAPEGVIANVPEHKLPEVLQSGDLVLCRLTAPLISLCLGLIEKRITARVRGREIGKQLTTVVKTVQQGWLDVHPFERVMPIAEFLPALDEYEDVQVAKLMRRKHPSESQIQALQDRVAAVRACATSPHFRAESVQELCADIESLFSEDNVGVTLCTVHRAKGLETDRVFLLKPEKMPLEWPGQQDWEREQEMNIKYVAHTRAKRELYYITNEQPADEKAEDDSAK